MTEQQFETDVMALLRASFSGPNDPGLVQRLRKLKAIFQAVDDPALAVKLYERLSAANSNDSLATAFQYRLSTSTRRDLLAVLTAVKGSDPKPAPRSQEYKLVDEDAKTVRTIAHSDPEYQERFVNHNISNVTSDPDPNTFEFHTMVVYYDDGRKLEIPLDDVPVRTRIPGMRLVRLTPHVPPIIDHYVLRKGTIIPMNANNEMMLNDSTTPTVVDLRTAIEINIQRRHSLLEIAMLTNTFAGLVAANISFLHLAVSTGPEGLFVRAMKPPGPKDPVDAPPGAPFRAPKQYKQVTARELLQWENEGGHVLGRHNEELTRKNLLDRVVGEKVLAVPASETEDGAPTNFSVWRGQGKTSAASKWADQATMTKAIGQIIHDNIDEIRSNTKAGQEWSRENQAVGYTTGSGWVKTGAGAQAVDRGVMWDENLKGITIVIRPRTNYVPTAKDPEGWFVYTAFPDRVRR
jgi:hypothetical protein